jgi:hypothetical protein
VVAVSWCSQAAMLAASSAPCEEASTRMQGRAIQVYQPPADGNTFASYAAFMACNISSAPPVQRKSRLRAAATTLSR